MSKKCNYKTFNPENLGIETKQEYKDSSETAYLIPLTYNYGTNLQMNIGKFEMELCELSSNFGVNKSKKYPNSPESILVNFNTTIVEQIQCIETLNNLYFKTCELLEGIKGKINKKKFSAETAEISGYKPLVYFPTDESGEKIPEKNGSMYLKLFDYEFIDKVNNLKIKNQTTFYKPNGELINKDCLKQVKMKFIPLMRIRAIRVAATITLQMEIKSAIVTSLIPIENKSSQLETLEELNKNDPELSNMVESQLATIIKSRELQLVKPNLIDETETQSQTKEQTELLNDLTPFDTKEEINQIPNSITEALQYKKKI